MTPATPAQPSPFNPGALVRLRSGGPVMTVRQAHEKIPVCVWFATDMPVEQPFNIYELEAVQDSRWLDQPDGPGYWWMRSAISTEHVLVEANEDMSVWTHRAKSPQPVRYLTGHKWCKVADEPPARP